MRRTVLSAIAEVSVVFLLGSFSLAQSTANPASPDGVKPGILVELFTSEGCSSCPPADELLRQLDAQSGRMPSQIVVLSEHVDYWDGTGWHDRFSSRNYTDRQDDYARRFHINEPYTPQMVVDGTTQFTGNDVGRLQNALREAGSHAKSTLRIAAEEVNPAEILVSLDAGPLPTGRKHADLFVALADNQDQTHVGGGENSGKDLQHVAVLRSLQKVGSVGAEGGQKQVKLRVPKSEAPANLRLVAFVQESGSGQVLGATVRLLGEPTR
jgi:hypothetical protein